MDDQLSNILNIHVKKIELMYRSSKLNEERVSYMRTNQSPLPDLNDHEGKESIIRYLPPIDLSDVYYFYTILFYTSVNLFVKTFFKKGVI